MGNFIPLSIFQMFSITFFGVFFGSFELFTNGLYILSRNYNLPRKQHRFELPENPTPEIISHKVFQMFILGTILTGTAILAFLISPYIFIVGAGMIMLNGLIDYSKFHKTSALVLWTIISIISGSLVLIVL